MLVSWGLGDGTQIPPQLGQPCRKNTARLQLVPQKKGARNQLSSDHQDHEDHTVSVKQLHHLPEGLSKAACHNLEKK